jgi:hypothetical protein
VLAENDQDDGKRKWMWLRGIDGGLEAEGLAETLVAVGEGDRDKRMAIAKASMLRT